MGLLVCWSPSLLVLPGCQAAGHEILNDEGLLLFEEMYELICLLTVAFHLLYGVQP